MIGQGRGYWNVTSQLEADGLAYSELLEKPAGREARIDPVQAGFDRVGVQQAGEEVVDLPCAASEFAAVWLWSSTTNS